MLVSVVIRTYNEERYLARLLDGIKQQNCVGFDIEIVLVDSGSTDSTLDIATQKGCRITHIKKSDFSFGRSLNVGCKFANGDYLVFISGHCIPATPDWIKYLIQPLVEKSCYYTYGRQLGHETTKFSECCLFDKHFPDYSIIPQKGFFCNNANAAISKESWKANPFDETLTGLEDMYLAKELVANKKPIGYVSEAGVYHIHDESWMQVRNRYEREAFALRFILPEMQFYPRDFIKYLLAGIYEDSRQALKKRIFFREIKDIILFRLMHNWGTYRGHHLHRELSDALKDKYFYPKDLSQMEDNEEDSTWNIK